MSDITPGPLSPEAQELIAFGLARRALKYMGAVLTPIVVLATWFSISSYKGLKEKYETRLARFDTISRRVDARAEALGTLADSLELTLRLQRAELAYNSREADLSLRRAQTNYDQLVREAAADRSELNHAVMDANSTSTRLTQSFAALNATTQKRIQGLVHEADSATRHADNAVRIAEEARVQTVGAGHRQELYGTPYEVSFAGVNRNTVRDLRIAYKGGGATLRPPAPLGTDDPIPLPNADRPEWYLSVINVLDIPRGLLLVGRSRADAATFRLTRVQVAAGSRSAGP